MGGSQRAWERVGERGLAVSWGEMGHPGTGSGTPGRSHGASPPGRRTGAFGAAEGR